MEKQTDITDKDLKEALIDMKAFVTEVNPKFLGAVRYKFAKPAFMEVSCIPLNLDEEQWK